MNRLLVLAALATAILTLSSVSPARALSSDGIAASVPQFEQVAAYLGPAPIMQKLHLVIFLAYPNQSAVDSFTQAVNDPDSPSYGAFMTPSQFAANFAPSPSTYSTVEYVLKNAGLQVIRTYANRKVIDTIATVGKAEALFHTLIGRYSYNKVIYYANSIPAFVPYTLQSVVMAVSGFNNFAMHIAAPPHVKNPLTTPFGYGPLDIDTAYNEPIHLNKQITGAGVTIAIETAYDYLDSDATGYWNAFGVKRTGYLFRKFVDDPVPQGLPLPGQSDETTLDMQQTTSNAPGANVLVYEGVDPLNSTFDDIYEQTVLDPRVEVVTTSWGSCEAGSDPNEVAADNDLFEQGAAEGQTRFAAAGDNGSRDCGMNNPPDGLPGQPNPINVDFPSSSPWIGASGGTTLVLNSDRTIKSESAWSGGGGGFSQFFLLPTYQTVVPTLGSTQWRNTPDVSLDADPNTPYALFYLGSWTLAVGGTSCVAPNLAAMYAQFDQYWGHRLGLSQAGLYNGFRRHTYPGTVWHDIITGNNGDYSAHPGYDNATGVGSLNAYNYMLQIPRTRSAPTFMMRRSLWHR